MLLVANRHHMKTFSHSERTNILKRKEEILKFLLWHQLLSHKRFPRLSLNVSAMKREFDSNSSFPKTDPFSLKQDSINIFLNHFTVTSSVCPFCGHGTDLKTMITLAEKMRRGIDSHCLWTTFITADSILQFFGCLEANETVIDCETYLRSSADLSLSRNSE